MLGNVAQTKPIMVSHRHNGPGDLTIPLTLRSATTCDGRFYNLMLSSSTDDHIFFGHDYTTTSVFDHHHHHHQKDYVI
jgi:hypothetical protein